MRHIRTTPKWCPYKRAKTLTSQCSSYHIPTVKHSSPLHSMSLHCQCLENWASSIYESIVLQRFTKCNPPIRECHRKVDFGIGFFLCVLLQVFRSWKWTFFPNQHGQLKAQAWEWLLDWCSKKTRFTPQQASLLASLMLFILCSQNHLSLVLISLIGRDWQSAREQFHYKIRI